MHTKPVWKILLVDDDEDDYFITRGMLAETHGADVEVEWVSSFTAGREALSTRDYDSVLMDYDLGMGTGLELIQEAVSAGCTYPIILLTGRGSPAVDIEAMQAGATMYLTKTEANPLLLERVIRYAIEMKEKEQALTRNAERQTLLVEISRDILSALPDRAALAKTVFERVRAHLQVDICLNYRIQPPSGPLFLVAGFGIPPDYQEATQRLSLGQAFCGTVAATAQPLAADHQRIQTDEKGIFVRGLGGHSYACHPLFTRDGRVIGTFSLGSTQRERFSPEDINFLQTLCHFVSLAWEQFDETERRLQQEL